MNSTSVLSVFFDKISSVRFVGVLLFLVTFLVYGNSIGNEYALDDDIVIRKNAFTQAGFSGLNDIFSSDAFDAYFKEKKSLVSGGRYRPLSVASFAIEIGIWGPNPYLSHAINVLLFAICGILLFFILKALLPPEKVRHWIFSPAFLITLLFVVHPIHTEVVANIKGRDEILTLLFSLLTLQALLHYVNQEKLWALGLAIPAFFLALLAKESSLPFLALFPFSIWFFRKGNRKSISILSFALLLSTTAYLFLRHQMVGLSLGNPPSEILNNPFLGVGLGDRLATISETMGIYLLKIAAPWPLSHDYYFNQIPIISWSNWKALLPGILYLGMAIAATRHIFKGKRNPVAFGVIFYFVSLSIVSNVFVSVGTTMGERFVFIPSLGLIIASVFGLKWLNEKYKLREDLSFKAGLAMAMIFAVLTILRNPVWKNNFTLFTTDVETSPNSAKARTSAGGVMVEYANKSENLAEKNKLLNGAIKHLNEAVKIYPEHGQAWLLLGNAYTGLNQNAKALQAYEKTIQLKPNFKDAYQNAAVVAGANQQYTLAGSYYRSLERLQPGQATIWYSRGVNFMNGSLADSALFAFERTLQLDPGHWEAQGNMALVLGRNKGAFLPAIQNGEKAIQMHPKAEWLYENLGIAYAMAGQLPQAIETFKRGLGLFPNSAKLHLNAGITYQNMSLTEQANQMFQKARQLDPSIPLPGPPQP